MSTRERPQVSVDRPDLGDLERTVRALEAGSRRTIAASASRTSSAIGKALASVR
jgi:hypothetical protein